ncbi:UDP-N-acetylmuramoyl-tripeptide--D-alanyl-D-alanine ligase [Gymnodinialimonas ceratoperidinii]|uniref:UDP-N-acetylmuramoyl-tripeptide--D-alanyl-D-alanine ligase n=1 Tax=Gymnodinialimonas ceratoperidinii TaxID=2856823 RepID=A0A8F6TZZ6_9RHOB|nr:UDP-N-acetylmuramoyl-tripeptide--D-alanyl-D-alanine ligase [Gymnodinialimonas ceratoperidinii]QXT41254.1 UDP-N-acetylmuramoyl-tripeptide--D-alanyl-D-alanine ligase [Gymnodinialimonas ceratoperidinii]
MSRLWTSEEAARATGGTATGAWEATGVSIDTRTLAPGDLFVALAAARDGHEFVAQALEAGACAAMVSHVPDGVDPAKCLLVDAVLPALERLGQAARARTEARVIAITGSVGKTTAKEMLKQALSGQGKVHAAVASYNNHWGVPLTLARMPADTDFAVIEIGMSNPGEIAPLARMARPHVAMITTIAPAHLEAFGVIEGIAAEKASIFEGLEPGGVAIVPLDVETSGILIDTARTHAAEVVTFGEAEGADLRLTDVILSDESTVMRLATAEGARLAKLSVSGRHYASNAVGVLCAVAAAGADPTQAAMMLSHWQPVEGRGQRERIVLSQTDDIAIELIDDAFNANPASLAAGLEVLAAITPARGGRRIAVLGDMLELGEGAEAMHADVAELPSMEAVDVVHTCGPLMEHLHTALPGAKRGAHEATARELCHALPRRLRPGDVVLVKGSKGSKVSVVVDALRKLGQSLGDQG